MEEPTRQHLVVHTFGSTVAKAVLKQAMLAAVVVVTLAAVRKRVAEFKLAEGAPKVVVRKRVAEFKLAEGAPKVVLHKRVAEFKLAEGAPKVVLHNPVAVRVLAMGLAIAQMVVPITAVDSNPAVSAAHQVVLAARNPVVVVLVLGFHKSASI